MTAPSGVKEIDDALKGGFIRPSNLMVVGAPLCGKREFGMQLLSAGLSRDEGAIYVSTSQTAEEVRAAWLSFGLEAESEEKGLVRFVDCYSKMLGAQSTDTRFVSRIPSLLDYTKLAVTVNDLCTSYLVNNVAVRLLFDSLSSLLIYSSLQTVMRFLHIFMGQLRKRKVLGFFLLEEGAHDNETFSFLKTFSNGVLRMDSDLRIVQFEGFPEGGRVALSYELTEKGVVLRAA